MSKKRLHMNDKRLFSSIFFYYFQILVSIIQSLITLNKTIFDAFTSLVIPSLLGIATTLNPDETIRITGAEASWLCEYQYGDSEDILR